jgi:hypothetical protein
MCISDALSRGRGAPFDVGGRLEYSIAKRLYYEVITKKNIGEDAVGIIIEARKLVCGIPKAHGVSTRQVLSCFVEIDSNKSRVPLASKAVIRCLINSLDFDSMFEINRKKNVLMCAIPC